MFDIELAYYKEGKRYIIGIDEVGRGPLAGDVVAAAVCVDFGQINESAHDLGLIAGVKDSKKLTEKKRRDLATKIKEGTVDFALAGASAQVIDKINILQATKLSMEKALKDLESKLRDRGIEPDLVLVDSVKIASHLETVSLTKGDDKCYSIGCASILAKVYRDDVLCQQYEEAYPGYGFAKHKGYGTKAHRQALIDLGPSPIHRRSFLKNMKKWEDEAKRLGDQGEEKAQAYLEAQGYKIIDRNFIFHNEGEIDLIARKDFYLVFVEVKQRKNANYGYGAEAVDSIKQGKIKKAAEYYYQFKAKDKDLQPRFDVIEIYTETDEINHFVDAFQ
ncbi:MAG: ribonuclease HII [Bacillota bacterium]|nr:ribonuclease HII [Bacillota bacterium]